MTAPFRIRSLTFNSGQAVEVAEADVVVLVGANNTGKSRTLLEMQSLLGRWSQNDAVELFALSNFEMEHNLDSDGLLGWLEGHRTVYRPTDRVHRVVRHLGNEVEVDRLRNEFQTDRLGQLAPILVRHLSLEERLGRFGAADRLDHGQRPEQPLQAMARDNRLRERLAGSVGRAFGQKLLFDSWGSNLRLRIHPTLAQGALAYSSDDGSLPKEMREEFDRIPLVDDQGDGIRAFIGIMLAVLAIDYPLYLIDEPELCLHPPQAREAGRQLASLSGQQQVFVATHSLDVLLGILEAPAEKRIQIIRLVRRNGKTLATELDPSALEEIRADPLLHFSRALDGIFHEQVVICEGGTDAAFYSLYAREASNVSAMITHASSKNRVHKIARALVPLGVSVSVILDFDALNDKSLMRRIVQSAGGAWSASMERAWEVLNSALCIGKPPATHGDVKRLLSSLGKPETEVFSESERQELCALTKPRTGWSDAKKNGLNAVPSGQASAEAESLLDQLALFGIHVVRHGAMESFIKGHGRPGSEWVARVIETGSWESCEPARSLVWSALGLNTQ